MKQIAIIWIVLAAIALSFISGFFCGRFSLMFDGFGAPYFTTDAEVRKIIRDSGITLPSDASDLSFLSYGFQDPVSWIAMKVSPADQAKIQKQFFATIHGTEKPISGSDFSHYSPSSFANLKNDKKINLTAFDLSSPDLSGVSKLDDKTGSEFAFFSDPTSGRVILVSISDS